MTSKPIRAIVVGGTGYTGAELVRLVLGHPSLELVSIVGNQTAGQAVGDVLPSLRGVVDGVVQTFDPDVIAERADVAFCALPHAASAEAVSALRQRGQKVLDLSADFRFENLSVYEAWYGKHPVPERLPEAVYGLVELHREELRDAELIAVPGCYPTAATLALAPLVQNGLVQSEGITVDAKSGVSGAGRAVSSATSFSETAEGARAYKAGAHRHGPEIEQELSRLAGAPLNITFVPHLVPMTRGILATCYAQPASTSVTAESCTEAARALYAGSPSVHVLDEGQHPDTLWVRGSNRVHVGYAQDRNSGTIIAMSAIDNLVKGASGQAIQCLNVRFGLDEGAGLRAPAQWP
ncbi:MAG: N-acetyl-gamma-glutamyl-phosphate reductase [Myxococcales bacterium]|jgi:N-acetyl-gamma-glutamyl-phosphate reductase|nr:N-acetyl-gamma-glutamyl-phosphate reductase [Myxococcales bacterium]